MGRIPNARLAVTPSLITAAPAKPAGQKDKLAQTKLREREVRESHRAELRADKDAGAAARAARDSLLRSERLEHDTKRAARDRRVAARRAAHAETGQECEHGVWRCRVCFPHADGKAKR